MFIRKRRRPVSEINVVPYIDVMLVLLVIFMVTAPLVTQGVKVELPKASAEPIEQDENPPIIASIDAKGLYYINIGDNQEQALDAAALAQLVQTKLQQNQNTPVVVKGDGAVPYKDVIALMVLLQNAGVPSVGLMTDPEDS